jgi:glycosyltransferase involved in cell wall biosynthesis
MPTVSIIVPVFNVEKYLPKCLNSILEQSFTDFELIIIDDESTDKSGQICDEYAATDARVRVIHKPNEGLQSAWINGLQISNGEYIGFVDSDDWIDIEMFSEMMVAMLENNADFVQCEFRRIIGNTAIEFAKPTKNETFENQDICLYLVPQILNFWEYSNPIVVPARWNKIFRREIIMNNIQYCDSRINLGEDLNITLPVLLDARKVVCLNNCYYNYRLNYNSITKGYKKDFYAAQQSLSNALIAEKNDWDQLTTTWKNVKSRLALAVQIRDVQEKRVAAERQKYSRGRTTTFNLLTAENDLDDSTLNMYRLVYEELITAAQAELYNTQALQ